MASSHGSKARVHVNGYDLSGFLTSVSVPQTQDVAEISAFGDTAKKYVPGLRDATCTLEGNYDSVANGEDEVIAAALGSASQKVVSIYPQGDAVGNRALGLSADFTAYDITDVLDDAAKFTAAMQSSVAVESGIVLHALGAEGSPGNGAGQDNGAGTSNGGVGYVQATAATGSATLKVQHSTDDISYPDLITFAAVSGRTAERKTVAGTVNRYTRANWTPGTSVTFAMHFARNP